MSTTTTPIRTHIAFPQDDSPDSTKTVSSAKAYPSSSLRDYPEFVAAIVVIAAIFIASTVLQLQSVMNKPQHQNPIHATTR